MTAMFLLDHSYFAHQLLIPENIYQIQIMSIVYVKIFDFTLSAPKGKIPGILL